ncbi:MAG: hypothetical protein ACK5ZV_01715, partial [bacterium]
MARATRAREWALAEGRPVTSAAPVCRGRNLAAAEWVRGWLGLPSEPRGQPGAPGGPGGAVGWRAAGGRGATRPGVGGRVGRR